MRFNTQKCYVLSTRCKTPYLYSLDGVILKQVQQNPYLGVLISEDLKWGPHITNLCRKAGSTLGFLRRNLRNCPKECRRLAYIALVRSRLEYGATVWDPHYKQDTEKLERVQRQAARFITRDYKSKEPGCVGRMLQELGLPTLAERRRQLRLCLLYKVVEGLTPAIPPEDFLTPVNAGRRRIRPSRFEGFESSNPVARHAISNTRGFQVPDSRTEQYRHSFFVRTVLDWNHLSDETVNAGTASAFTAALGRQTSPPS